MNATTLVGISSVARDPPPPGPLSRAPLLRLFGPTVLALAALLAVAVAGCSPEDGRTRGRLGADIGNTALPVQMHGNRERNNPAANVPDRGRVPRDGRGVPGWWAP